MKSQNETDNTINDNTKTKNLNATKNAKIKNKKKDREQKNISNVFLENSILLVLVFILFFTFAAIMTILAFNAGIIFSGNDNTFGIFLISSIVMAVIVLVLAINMTHNKTKNFKKLEEATYKISKGDFKVQIEYTNDDNFNSFIENFNKMVRELDNMETLKEDFVSNVSHEFKTPLAVIKSYSKALRDETLDEATKKQYQEILDNNIAKLTTLTSNILNLSRLEHQEIQPEKKTFLLDEQLRQCILSFEPQWTEKNLDLQLELPETKYYGTQELIAQIWQNIIGNAIKFSNQDGKLGVEIKNTNDYVIVSISDNGQGMTKETKEKIFEKFYQGDTSHTGKGNGLGLALVNRILKICDAKINVESELGNGSTFEVLLPIENTKNS